MAREFRGRRLALSFAHPAALQIHNRLDQIQSRYPVKGNHPKAHRYWFPDTLCSDIHLFDVHQIKPNTTAFADLFGAFPECYYELALPFSAPVFDIHQGVGQRGAIVAGEVILLADDAGSSEDVRGNEFVEQALKFAFGKADAVESLEFLAEVFFQRGAVADIGTIGVFETAQLFDEPLLDALLLEDESLRIWGLWGVDVRGHGRGDIDERHEETAFEKWFVWP